MDKKSSRLKFVPQVSCSSDYWIWREAFCICSEGSQEGDELVAIVLLNITQSLKLVDKSNDQNTSERTLENLWFPKH